MDFITILTSAFNWLKQTCFEFLGVSLSLFDLLIGGIFLYLVWYFIFRIGD